MLLLHLACTALQVSHALHVSFQRVSEELDTVGVLTHRCHVCMLHYTSCWKVHVNELYQLFLDSTLSIYKYPKSQLPWAFWSYQEKPLCLSSLPAVMCKLYYDPFCLFLHLTPISQYIIRRNNLVSVVKMVISTAWRWWYLSFLDDEEEGEEGEEGEEKMPSCGDYIMHFLTLPWKLIFAFIPPTGSYSPSPPSSSIGK